MAEAAKLQPRARFWVERDGAIVMSDWRMRFLEAIAETGSITAASARLGVPYRRFWGKLREIEANVGQPLVEAQSGGATGGGARLTPFGSEMVQRYGRYRDGLEALLLARFEAAFGDLELEPPAQPRP